MKFKILVLVFGFTFTGYSAQLAKEKRISKQQSALPLEQSQQFAYVDVKLDVVIEIPPKAMPKKSFITVGIVFGDFEFKTFTFQDDKINGNAPKVVVSKGATLSYSDGVRIYEELPEDLNPEIGVLTVEVLRKGKPEVISYGFSWGTATSAYFDRAQKKQFTYTVTATRKVVFAD